MRGCKPAARLPVYPGRSVPGFHNPAAYFTPTEPPAVVKQELIRKVIRQTAASRGVPSRFIKKRRLRASLSMSPLFQSGN